MWSNQSFLTKSSIRKRLFIAACIWLGSLILLAGIVIPSLVSNYLHVELQKQLQLAVDEISNGLVVDKNEKLVLSVNPTDLRYSKPYSGLYWIVYGNGQLLRSDSLVDTAIDTSKGLLYGAKGEELDFLEQQVLLKGESTAYNIVVGIEEGPMEESIKNITSILWLILLLLFIGVLLFTVVQASWSLRPLSHLQTELKLVEGGKQQALHGNYPMEVQPLVSDLNAMLFHYTELLERARHHAGNLSHSLKTPLAILNNQIAELTDDDRDKLSDTIKQVQHHIDYHLSRTRVAGAMSILSAKSSPSKRVDAFAAAFDKLYSSRNVLLVNELAQEIEVAVDPNDLDEMLGNLIENAYKWSKSLIRVYSVQEGERVTIFVEDDGVGIDKEQLEKITQRGFRLDESAPGSGLGLNIVAEIARSYRGKLCFEKSSIGGLKAILMLSIAK
ncbi:sensor histidine kinase [Vibrio sp. MACH09]|uniref:ATP-binding protein n=1 Tax=Vibrio sp. MACH09 TaxID=3025122 RepID=UPI002793C0A5|nr:ATP-binding protein [Vibrio sp. MACH09]GLO63941.1 sensor histidine kinase [Vibrio sp. MACH09]